MKQHYLKFLIFCISFNYHLFPGFGQSTSLQKEAISLERMLEKHHYDPRKLDDRFSELVFYKFLFTLDDHGLHFTDQDLKSLIEYKTQIDDELKGKSWFFLPKVTELYKKKLLNSEKLFTEILDKPLDFSNKETISFNKKSTKDTVDFAETDIDLKKRWNRWLKYQTLWQLYSHYYSLPAEQQVVTDVLKKEPEMRAKVKTRETRNIKQVLEHPGGFEEYVASLFFNSITAVFDPHTTYMSKTEWQNFQSQLSTEAYSFGFDLTENEAGDVVVARLIPGGPAWKSNDIHKDDALVQLKWEGKEVVDLSGASLDEVEELLEASNKGKLEMTIRKTSGQIKTVVLAKEKLREEENVVKSFILSGDKKIGYISLPGFYTEWENFSGAGCANDVAKEIVKLKQENIEGLILDIRYNGGGSLLEGLNLAGIFINEGPLFMLQGRERKPLLMKDLNRGTIYDGPLVLMVNGLSASASEVLASTLQDFNRAVIVGSNTFGKATGQEIMSLDTTTTMRLSENKTLATPYGFISVTCRKLYRITGKSAQLKGVRPDIHLPDIYEKSDYRESAYPYALSSDSVTKKVVYYPLASLPLEKLSIKSSMRVQRNDGFNSVYEMMDKQELLKESMREDLPLNFDAFRKRMEAIRQGWQSMEKAEERTITTFKVSVPGYDQQVMEMDTYGKEMNDIIIKNLQSDIYIEESYFIIKDLIELSNN